MSGKNGYGFQQRYGEKLRAPDGEIGPVKEDVLAKDSERTAELEGVLLGYIEESNEIRLTDVEQRPFHQRMTEAAPQPFAPLL